MEERGMDHLDHCWCGPLGVDSHQVWVNWHDKRCAFKELIRGRVHCKASPSVDGALGAIQL